MALVHCPECDKEISDMAESCPSCGYVLEGNKLPKTRKTELSGFEKNSPMGVLGIVMGIIAIIIGIPLISVIVGVLVIIGGFIFLSAGINNLSGTHKGTCPYCNSSVVVASKAVSYKCTRCKKRSLRNGGYLETVE